MKRKKGWLPVFLLPAVALFLLTRGAGGAMLFRW